MDCSSVADHVPFTQGVPPFLPVTRSMSDRGPGVQIISHWLHTLLDEATSIVLYHREGMGLLEMLALWFIF